MPAIWTFLGLHLLATMSPGPDFALVSQNSLVRSRRAGFFTALGITSANFILLLAVLLGLGTLVTKSPQLRWIVEAIGSSFLIWIGVQSLRPARSGTKTRKKVDTQPHPSGYFYRQGLVMSLFNAKVWLYFTAFVGTAFSQTPKLSQKLFFTASMLLISFFWFSTVAFFFGHPRLQHRLERISPWMDRAIGVLLVILGCRIWVELVEIART